MESVRRISPKDKNITPKDSRISPKDKKLSPKDSRISPKDKKLSPKDSGISPKDNPRRQNVGNSMMKIWKLGCGNEVKGEGYILNLILYSFFRVFPIFDPRVLF